MSSSCGGGTGSGSGTTGVSLTTQRCGMRLARKASTCGRPSCSAWKPKASVTAVQAVLLPVQQVAAGRGLQPGPNSIIDGSRAMNLVALPAFADNYIWMLHDGAQAVVVDPGDAAPVQAALDRLGCSWRRF
jgi:hypothetical protein